MNKIGRNEPCPCGSGKKYKKCHDGKPIPATIPTSRITTLTLRQRNEILLNAVGDIFDLARGVSWEEVKRRISGDQVKELYQAVGALWPLNTDLSALLPQPDNRLRALYLGEVKPEQIIRNVFRFGLYTDEILIVSPFLNPRCVARDYNPVFHPDQYRADTIKLVFFLVLLEPWIRAGLVSLIPDPGDFDYSLRRQTWDMAKARCQGWKPSEEEVEEYMDAGGNDAHRIFLTLPDEYLTRIAKQVSPDLKPEQITEVIAYLREKRRDDPIALDQSIQEAGGQMLLMRTGGSLEMALYICHLTGAFPFTNFRRRWEELLSAAQSLPELAQVWTPLTKAFQELDFKFLENVDSAFACQMRNEGRLESFRAFLRRLWTSLGGQPDAAKMSTLAMDFKDELSAEYQKAEADWNQIDRDLVKWGGTAVAGAVASGGLALDLPALGFALAGVTQLLNARMRRRAFRQSIPLSVFIDLSRHRPARASSF